MMEPAAEGERRSPQVESPSLDSRKVMLVGIGLLVAFGSLGLWSLLTTTPDLDAMTSSAETTGTESQGTDEPINDVRPPGHAPAEQPLVSGRLLPEPRKISALLGQQFQHHRPDGTADFTSLRSILGSTRSVTVINVWATYCEPCKREFPGFRELQKGWGDNVRFLPIQLGDGELGELRSVMPTAPDQLIDYVPGGAVLTELGKLGELPTNAPIPVTMLLDCKQELRWVQKGEVKDMQAFDDAVQALREELRSPKCSVRTPPASQPIPLIPNTKAKPRPSTDLPPALCRDRCKANQTCTRRYDGTYHCLDDLE